MDYFTSKPALVVTSISSPNECLISLAKVATQNNFRFVCVGDLKSPETFELDGCEFFSHADQLRQDLVYAKSCPSNHYARKNIGYLLALKQGASFIRETDDDNLPGPSFFDQPNLNVKGRHIEKSGWVNAYAAFTDRKVWPRGFPLELLHRSYENDNVFALDELELNCPIQQCLADGDPDVDAVYRLTHSDEVLFSGDSPIIFGRTSYCPFNSQNTTWFPEAYPLLYLPSTVSMRMTDIWRSYVAQVCLYAAGLNWSYHAPTVYQHRNEHDLIDDFRLEIPGYLDNQKIMNVLLSLELSSDKSKMIENVHQCYVGLVDNDFISNSELRLLESWCSDYSTIVG